MADIIASINAAQEYAGRIRPKVGGFPFLAEALRQAGVQEYVFDVPSASAVLITADGAVLQPGTPLHAAMTVISPFDESALLEALRTDQVGDSTFPEFVAASFLAGVVRFTVDLNERTCTYQGVRGETYLERYPAVEIPDSPNTLTNG